MYVFLTFLLVCILLFSIEFTVLGVEYTNEDYPAVANVIYYYMQTFRNSLGDVAPPGYSKWVEYQEFQHTMNRPWEAVYGAIIIYIIWGLWVLNIIVGCVILLNFLIAIISQSYEQVMAQHILHKYKHRCDINRYCLIIRSRM